MNAPNPDRPLIADESISAEFNVCDLGAGGIVPLVLLSQRLIAYLEGCQPSSDWRTRIYKELADDATDHNQEGTGSVAETQIWEGMNVAAELLKVRNTQ